MPKQRLTPEKLLERVQAEERQEKGGKLKIYLGSAPGVGKTYSMLLDALAKRASGLDVVIGVVESHGRKDTETLCQGFEILPRQQIEYREQHLVEFDLDTALKRNPGLILMDEMAHTNVPGVRHAKRWQDVKELLDSGIDVYTTLNVQHIESLNDAVSQILHARVKETVPDFMLERANTIELIDLPQEELLKRLQEGKVYFPAQAEFAEEHFFRQGNLIALREIALRFTAERVGNQVLLYRQGQGIQHIWPTKEKILVCVGAGPDSTKLIRTAKRIASHLQTDWMAIHIDVPTLNQSQEERNNTIQSLRLAEQLGATTRMITGINIVKEIIKFAREQNVNLIMIGKAIRPRWKEFLFHNLSDEIIRNSAEIDVYVITGTVIPKKFKLVSPKHSFSLKTYAVSVATVALASVINFLLEPFVDTSNLMMVYLLGVTIVALLGQMGPAVLASILSVIAYGYFFILPSVTFTISYIQYFFTLAVMLLITQVIGQLTLLARRQIQKAQSAEQRTLVLHTLSMQLASARGTDKLLDIAVHYLAEIFNSEIMILFPNDGSMIIKAKHSTEKTLSTKEQSVAKWVYDLGQVAGIGTDTLPYSDALYIPLLSSQAPIGVIRILPLQKNHLLTSDQIYLLEACASQIAFAVELGRLEETKTAAIPETNPIQNTLLRNVSQELRKPLVSIMGAAKTQMEMSADLDATKIENLGHGIYDEAEQLNRLLNNLLQISYLEAEEVNLAKESCSLHEVILLAINSSYKKLGNKQVQVHIQPNLPDIPIDKVLIRQVFLNLIDNAIKFTPPESPIDIVVNVENDAILVNVEDRGPGIAPDEVNKLFEKFYRGRLLTTERGLGLGLALCRSIIAAHGGTIWAKNRTDGGSVFSFTLPLHITGELKNA